MSDLKDTIASYVADYPRFEESANEVADLILDAVIDEILAIVLKEPEYISSSQSTRQGYVRAVNDMKRNIKKLNEIGE